MNKVSNAADLSRALRKALGDKTQAELAALLLVSRNYISQIESDLKPPSERLEREMRRLLTELENNHKVSSASEGPQVDYVKTRGSSPSENADSMVRVPRMITPRHAIKGDRSSRAECEAYIKALFDAAEAEGVPFHHLLGKLKKYFPLDEFASTETKP